MTPKAKVPEPRASRSGTRWTDADRVARGQRRLVAWLPAECLARLDELVEESGYSRPEFLEALIDLAHQERRETRARRRAKR